MNRSRSLGLLFLWLLVGAVVGSLLGDLVALVLPGGVVRQFFLTSTRIGLGPVTLDLAVASLTLGFSLTINVLGVAGILFAGYYFRWYR
jgi:hypothetical protein